MSEVDSMRTTVTARWFFDNIILGRRIIELCLVGILKQVDKSGNCVPREALLSQLNALQTSELNLIRARPRTALALYRFLYQGDVDAARETIAFLKQHDLAAEYGSQPVELE